MSLLPGDSSLKASQSLPAKLYFPKVGDQLVGVIEDKGGDFYKVNIFCGYIAMLPRLGFDGATKRNRPELNRGDTIYCRVVFAEKGLDVGKGQLRFKPMSSLIISCRAYV